MPDITVGMIPDTTCIDTISDSTVGLTITDACGVDWIPDTTDVFHTDTAVFDT